MKIAGEGKELNIQPEANQQLVDKKVFQLLTELQPEQIVEGSFQNGRLYLEASSSYQQTVEQFLSLLRTNLQRGIVVEGYTFYAPLAYLSDSRYQSGIQSESEGDETFQFLNEKGTIFHRFTRKIMDRKPQTVRILSEERILQDYDPQVATKSMVYEPEISDVETGLKTEIIPTVNREANRVRLQVKNYTTRRLTQSGTTEFHILSAMTGDKRGPNVSKEKMISLPVLNRSSRGASINAVARDNNWIFMNLGGGEGSKRASDGMVLAMKVKIQGGTKDPGQPFDKPKWMSVLEQKMEQKKLSDLPTREIRLHQLIRSISKDVDINFHLTDAVLKESRNGALNVHLPDRNWSVSTLLQHLKRYDLTYDLQPDLIVLRAPQERSFRKRELLMYNLSSSIAGVPDSELPDRLMPVRTGEGAMGGGIGLLGPKFHSKKTSDFGAALSPEELIKIIKREKYPSTWKDQGKMIPLNTQYVAAFNFPEVHREVVDLIRRNESFPSHTNILDIQVHEPDRNQLTKVLQGVPVSEPLSEDQLSRFREQLVENDVPVKGRWTLSTTGGEQVYTGSGRLLSGVMDFEVQIATGAEVYDPVVGSQQEGIAMQGQAMVVEESEKQLRLFLRIHQGEFGTDIPGMKQQTVGGEYLTFPLESRQMTYTGRLEEEGTMILKMASDPDQSPLLIEISVSQDVLK